MALEISVRRLVLTAGFAVAVVAAPGLAALAGTSVAAPSVAECPSGESSDTFTGVCTPELVPNSPVFGATSPGGLPEVSGIPCSGANSGQCIGLAEEQQAAGPIAVPRSTVSSSP